MADIVNCPACQRKLRLPDGSLGKKLRCPGCKTTFEATAAQDDPIPYVETAVTATPPPIRPPLPTPKLPTPKRKEPADYDDRRGPSRERRARTNVRRPSRKVLASEGSSSATGWIIFAILVGVFGAVAATVLVAFLMVSRVNNNRQAARPFQPLPQQNQQDLRKDVQAAFKDLPARELAEINADLKPFFGELGAAFMAQDGNRIAGFFDFDRLVDEAAGQGALPQQLLQQRAQFVSGIRQGAIQSLAKSALVMRWNSTEIKHLKKQAPNEVIVISRHRASDNTVIKMRWWLTKRDGTWKVYDLENLEGGTRMSTLLAVVLPGAGVDLPALQRIASATDSLRDAAAALVIQRDPNLADQKLQAIAANPLPAPLEAWRWLLTGMVRLQRGQNDTALQAFEQAHRFQADMPALDLCKGMAYSRLGQWDKALKYLEAYRDLLGDDDNVCYELGEALRAVGRQREAAVQYRRALDNNPQHGDAYLGLIRALSPLDNRDDLAARFAKLGSHHQNFNVLAEDCKSARDGESLVIICGAMRKVDPGYGPIVYYEALAKAWTKKPLEAIRLLEGVLAKEKDANKRQAVEKALGEALVDSGSAFQAYDTLPDSRAAFRILAAALKKTYRLDDLEKLMVLHAKNIPNDELLPFYNADMYVQRQRYLLADKTFVAGMVHPPNKATLGEFRASRVTARYFTGHALSAYQEIGPKNDTFKQLASLLFFGDHFDQLQTLLDAHAKNNPQDEEAFQWRIRLTIKQCQTAKAVQLFQAALARPFRDNNQRLQMISNFFYDMADQGHFLEAYAVAPDKDSAFQTLAGDLQSLGWVKDLPQLIEAHRRKHADDPWLDFYTAQADMEEQAWAKAADVLQKAWDKAPPPLRDRFRWPLLLAYYKAGKAREAYQRIEPRQETYRELADMFIAEKKGLDFEGFLSLHWANAGSDASLVMFHLIRAKVFENKITEALTLFQRNYNLQQQKYLSMNYDTTFALDLLEMGHGIEGYQSAPDKPAAFQALASRMLLMKNDKDLAEMVRQHLSVYWDDSWAQYYKGEVHLLRGEIQKADQVLSAALAKAKATDPSRWQTRNAFLRARIKAGKTAATYQEQGAGMRTFDELANLCSQEKNAAQLEALITFHRQAFPEDTALRQDEVEVCWLKKDYEGALKLIADQEELISTLPQYRRKYDNYQVRCLVKLNRGEEAVLLAESIAKRNKNDRVLLAYVHAAHGDVAKTIQAIAQPIPSRYLLQDCYRDEDLGPILRSDAFREFRTRFPEPKGEGDRYGEFYGDG